MKAQTVTLKWIALYDKKPTRGATILCAILNRYDNAPWEWSYYTIERYDGSFREYETPDMWAVLPSRVCKMDRAYWKRRDKLEMESEEC